MKFRIKEGSHASGGAANVLYKQGDVIESDEDLCKIFVNKFERVDETPKSVVVTGPARAPKEGKISAIAAQHEEELSALERGPQGDDAKIHATDDDQEADEEEHDPAEAKGPLGTNVTDRFEKATKADVAVWVKNRKYNVTDSQTNDKALNDKPLTKTEVDKYIDSMLED